MMDIYCMSKLHVDMLSKNTRIWRWNNVATVVEKSMGDTAARKRHVRKAHWELKIRKGSSSGEHERVLQIL